MAQRKDLSNQNGIAAARLVLIALALVEDDGKTREQWAQEFGVTVRTITRDIRFLRDCVGMDIRFARDEGRFYLHLANDC